MRRQNKPGFLSVGDVLGRLAREFNVEQKREEFEAMRGWEDIVGRRVAKHTAPLYIRQKTLYIQTEGSSWAQEIAFMKTKIVSTLNERFGRPRIEEIRCRIGDKDHWR